MEYGSIFETSSNRAFTREGSGFLQSDWQLFRSGRDAMKALARSAGRRRVLLPALCCESMLVPIRFWRTCGPVGEICCWWRTAPRI